MAAKTSRHRYESKLRYGHPMYTCSTRTNMVMTYACRRRLSCRWWSSCARRNASEAGSCWVGTRTPCSPCSRSPPSFPRPGMFDSHTVVATVAELSTLRLAWVVGGSIAEWLACWTQAQKRPGSNRDATSRRIASRRQPRRCRVTVLGKLFTPIVLLFTKQQNW